MHKKTLGFTLVELLVVLVVVGILMGVVLPVGSQLRKRAILLSEKTDALRFQTAFMDYFQQYHCFPASFPLDTWFDLSQYFRKFLKEFSGEQVTKNNPDGIKFCEFTSQELLSSRIEPMFFFLCKNLNPLQAQKELPCKEEVLGTRVLFYIK